MKPILKKVESCSTDLSEASSDEGTPETKSRRPLHKVKFDMIQVRDYNITLGDNPSCSYGPPVSLDWEYDERDPISLESFEDVKSKIPRRKAYQMHMISRQRSDLLRNEAGFTDDEIEKVVEEMRKIQKERSRTKMGLPFSKLHEIAESVGKRHTK